MTHLLSLLVTDLIVIHPRIPILIHMPRASAATEAIDMATQLPEHLIPGKLLQHGTMSQSHGAADQPPFGCPSLKSPCQTSTQADTSLIILLQSVCRDPRI